MASQRRLQREGHARQLELDRIIVATHPRGGAQTRGKCLAIYFLFLFCFFPLPGEAKPPRPSMISVELGQRVPIW